MASFKIPDLLIFGSEEGHLMTDWTAVDTSTNAVLFQSINDKINLRTIRVDLRHPNNDYFDNCSNLEVTVRVNIGGVWSSNHVLTPIPANEDIII